MKKSALLLGLPEAGKSTYIAALYHLMESSEVEGSLTLAHLDEERSYINMLWERWLAFKDTERTSTNTDEEIRMTLQLEGEELLLHIPDLAGEKYERCLIERQWPESLGEVIRESRGFLLFIHPRALRQALTINQFNWQTAGLEEEPCNDCDLEPALNEFAYEKVSTQVLLVDLLQLICQARDGEPYKLAVIISAYDLLVDPLKDIPAEMLPPNWLAKSMPLLDQYLRSSMSKHLKIFGVSAQGGDLRNEKEKQRLYTTSDASERVWIIEEGLKHADLTAPIRWLLGLGDADRAND
jgi:hypothetical protein